MAIRRFSSSSISTTGGKSSKLWDQETTLGTFESIAVATVDSSGASSITFSNIPQTYRHLQIRGSIRGGNESGMSAAFNGSTGNGHTLFGANAARGSFVESGVIPIGGTPNSANTSSVFGALVCDILDYSVTTKNKTTRSFYGTAMNVSGNTYVMFSSGLWASTSAITSIVLTLSGSGSFAENSRLSLYGIRGA
jgi:hypothetical protein